MQCQCGSTDIDTDSGRVDSVCRQCGSVLEECGIVTEVQYIPDSHGNKHNVGTLISFDGSTSYSLGHRYYGKESRAITLQNARQNIQSLASRLQLKSHAVDAAFNFYKMALNKQLTKGRKSTHVVAACVYMHCRQESTPHMLLDLSEILKINVYDLGKTYLRLSSALCIQAPILDPALYIARFAHQLDFGDKEEAVVCVASKLVARMRSDWIHLGRRPSGLCGAALLVAARLYNFNRTIEDIIKVVKVCQTTVRKRLNEFSDTPSGKLSIDDFMEVNLSEQQDPPCFKNARRKLRELEDEKKAKELEKQVTEIRKEIEKVLENTRKKSPFEKFAEKTTDNESANGSLSESTAKSVDMLIAENTVDTLEEVLIQEDDSRQAVVNELAPLLMEESNDVEDLTAPSSDSSISISLQDTEPPIDTLALKKADTGIVNDDLDLTGIDDKELDRYFMKPHEYQRKDEVWHMYNADYLQVLKEREERKALEEEENAKKPNRKKKRKRGTLQGNTAGEVIEKIIQQKKISFKLDYDVLKSLNPDNVSTEVTELKIEEEKNNENPLIQRTVRPKQKKLPALVPLNIKKGMSDIVGNSRRKTLAALAEENGISNEPVEKKIKTLESEVIVQVSENSEAVITNNNVQQIDIPHSVVDEIPEIEELDDEEEEYDSELESYDYKEEIPPDYYASDEYVDEYDEE